MQIGKFEGTIVPTVLDGPEAWSKSIAESRNKVLQNYGVSDTHRQRERNDEVHCYRVGMENQLTSEVDQRVDMRKEYIGY